MATGSVGGARFSVVPSPTALTHKQTRALQPHQTDSLASCPVTPARVADVSSVVMA